MTDSKKPLSPVTEAVWEAFNEADARIFVDYGHKLAAAFRALAVRIKGANAIRQDILNIADELDQ